MPVVPYAGLYAPDLFAVLYVQVTLSRDGGTGDYALEAGALVLADQGIVQYSLCCTSS